MVFYIDKVAQNLAEIKKGLEGLLPGKIGPVPVKSFDDLRDVLASEIDAEVAAYRKRGKRYHAYRLAKRKEKNIKDFIGQTRSASPVFIEYNGVLYVNNDSPVSFRGERRVKLAHELGHLYLRNNRISLPHGAVSDTFNEGFGEYLALKVLPLFDQDELTLGTIEETRERRLNYAERAQLFPRFRDTIEERYAVGFNFFMLTVGDYNPKRLQRVLRLPPISIEEIQNPAMYHNRTAKL